MMRGLLLCRETERRPVIASPTNHENSAHAHSSLSRCYHIYITLDHTGRTAEDNACLLTGCALCGLLLKNLTNNSRRYKPDQHVSNANLNRSV